MNGLDDAERAEVLYDVYVANVYQNGNGEDEQGRVLHTMFDQVIIENVSVKILYPIFDYPHEHYTFKHFEV